MRYRILTVDEWGKLEKFRQFGPIPPPTSSACAVAENEEGEVKAALFIQLVLHEEPLVIEEDARGEVNFLRLCETVEREVAAACSGPVQLFVFSPDAKIGRMAKLNGMTKLPWMVWEKKIKEGE